LLELREHEERALLVVHALQNSAAELQLLRRVRAFVRTTVVRRQYVGIRVVTDGVEPFPPSPPPVVEHGATDDGEEPRFERGAGLEVVEATVDDDEDLLANVSDGGVRDPQARDRAPHEVEVVFVDTSERVLGLLHVGPTGVPGVLRAFAGSTGYRNGRPKRSGEKCHEPFMVVCEQTRLENARLHPDAELAPGARGTEDDAGPVGGAEVAQDEPRANEGGRDLDRCHDGSRPSERIRAEGSGSDRGPERDHSVTSLPPEADGG